MKRGPYRHLEPTAAKYFPSLSDEDPLNLNVHIFIEDVSLGVMPIGGRTQKQKGFAVVLEGEKDECDHAAHLIGKIGTHDGYDLAETVCDAVNEIAEHLAWEGCAAYEIIAADGTTDLHSFTSKRLVRLPGWFLQVIPRKDWELWKKKWVIIPAGKIWYVEMPSALGGRNGYKRMLRKLRRFDHPAPAFWRQDLERGEQSKNFEFQQYVKNSEIYFRQVTKNWGWNRRDWSQQWSVEFFNFYKMATFRWAQAILREHIITEINRLFSRLGIACGLRISGLPTASEILQVRRELQEGIISFAKASDKVSV